MKILAIRGENLASLEGAFEVDFTEEPLKSAGIFAISGTTGSGKSTLLDAMCLALYAEAPRFDKAPGKEDIYDRENETITIKDSRNILRRGATQAYAEVDFLALNKNVYRATWSVKRAYNKVNGALQSSTYSIFNITSETPEQGTKTALLNRIVELTGLTYYQFTRSVLLAQGDFANFLKATQNEKAELLEKLTGTEIYSKISKTIYEKCKEHLAFRDSIQQKIDAVSLLTQDEIVSINNRIAEISKQQFALSSEISDINGRIIWKNKSIELDASLNTAMDASKKSQTVYDAAKERFDYYAKILKTAEIRDIYRDIKKKSEELTKAKDELIKSRGEKVKYDKSLQDILEKLAQQQQYKVLIQEQWDVLNPKLKKLREKEITISEVKKNLSAAQTDKLALEKEELLTKENIALAQSKISSIQKDMKVLKEFLDKHKYFEVLVPEVNLLKGKISDIKKAKASSSEIIKKNELLIKQIETNTAEYNRLKEKLDELNSMQPEEVLKIREKLSVGDICPVCGNQVIDLLESDIKSMQEAKISADKEAVKAKMETIEIKNSQANNDLVRLDTEIKSLEAKIIEDFNLLEEYLGDTPLWESHEDLDKLLDKIIALNLKYSDNSKKLNESEKELEGLGKRSESLEEGIVSIAKKIAEKTDVCAEIEKNLDSIKAEINEIINIIKDILGKISDSFSSDATFSADAVESSILGKIKAADNDIEKSLEEKADLESEINKLAGLIDKLGKMIEELGAIIDSYSLKKEEWLKDNPEISADLLDDILSKDTVWVTKEKNELDKIREDLNAAKNTLKNRTEDRDKLLESKPEDLIMEDDRHVSMLGEDVLDILNDILGTKTKVKDDISAEKTKSEVLLNNDKEANKKIESDRKELEKRSKEAEKWTILNKLLGSADGSKFKTIAQGYTLDILLDSANEHLKDIAPRYVLSRTDTDSLSLQVTDLDMLSEKRSVHTLSGGESFLVSLALALGLSSLSSSRMNVESLFIDEGFGSLDADTLSVAMDALEKLETMGRKIGVISHVSEMSERIRVQIKVKKNSNGGSQVLVG